MVGVGWGSAVWFGFSTVSALGRACARFIVLHPPCACVTLVVLVVTNLRLPYLAPCAQCAVGGLSVHGGQPSHSLLLHACGQPSHSLLLLICVS
jgi:hypothetical protein